MSEAIVLKAPAKLNLTLEVVQRLPSGYHNLRSIFVRVDKLADAITVQVDTDQPVIVISSNSSAIPIDDTNICHRAAARYLDAIGTNVGVRIHIDKRIPVAAGLGGGSSDAAAVLLALNRHFGDKLCHRNLAELGAELGKDIAFFLNGASSAYVSGMGDVIEPLSNIPPLRFLIVNPGIAVSTAQAYQALARHIWFMDSGARIDISRVMAGAIVAGDVRAIAAMLYNDFEPLLERQHPVIKELKQALLAFGAIGALMSGSGPTVFGVFDSDDALSSAQAALVRHYPTFFVAAA